MALKHAREAAAKERSGLTAQLEAGQQAASDAQAQAQRLTAELSQLQVRDCVLSILNGGQLSSHIRQPRHQLARGFRSWHVPAICILDQAICTHGGSRSVGTMIA